MKRVISYLMLLTLTACATAAQRQAMHIQSVGKKASDELKACITDVQHKPEYESIAPHMLSAERSFQPTMAQLADETYPGKQESKLIILYHDDMLVCRQVALQKFQTVAPTIAQILTEEWVESDKHLMQLVKRKITWGESMRQTQQLIVVTQKKILAASQQIEAGLAASHQAEMAQRQAASNALMQWSLQQQMINAAQYGGSGSRIMCSNNPMASGTMPNPTLCQSY